MLKRHLSDVICRRMIRDLHARLPDQSLLAAWPRHPAAKEQLDIGVFAGASDRRRVLLSIAGPAGRGTSAFRVLCE